MRNPEKVLNTLCLHSKVSDYKYERLYRIVSYSMKICFMLLISVYTPSKVT